MSSWSRSSVRAVVVLVVAAVVGCAHDPAPNREAQNPEALRNQWETGLPHLAMGCLVACQEATYVELSPKGDLCRCWAPDAFQYTFAFPDTPDKLARSRSRWNTGVQTVRRCRADGKAWEPSEDREQIVCLDPSAPPPPEEARPNVAGRSATSAGLPDSVF